MGKAAEQNRTEVGRKIRVRTSLYVGIYAIKR